MNLNFHCIATAARAVCATVSKDTAMNTPTRLSPVYSITSPPLRALP